jgi:hypothetical protein
MAYVGNTIARRLVVPALLLALGGCSGSVGSLFAGKAEPGVDPNLYPTSYKQEILATMPRILSDASYVRDALITDPMLRKADTDQRYTVCIRANSRDSNLQYMGAKDYIAYFWGGHLNQLVEATPEQCGNAPYKPFPELEHLCQAKSCQ